MEWLFEQSSIDWSELSNLYRLAPLGEKAPRDLEVAFSNAMYRCFIRDNSVLIGAGRVLADGIDCAYLCDVAVHPDHQGRGLGKAIVARLLQFAAGHRKVILYANPGTEDLYR